MRGRDDLASALNLAADLPERSGLYDPRFEHDACGVAFVVQMKGLQSHDIVAQGLLALDNLEHRGASGAEVNTGDGAGILIQVPDEFLREVVGASLPPLGSYAVGLGFLPTDARDSQNAKDAIEAILASEGLRSVSWRPVVVRPEIVGPTAQRVMPSFEMLTVASAESGETSLSGMDLERRVYVARKRIEHEVGTYFASLSSRTLVYKGMLNSTQLGEFFVELRDPRIKSALALVHSRFSTNTFPSWPLAHPYRYLAHNGEINTVQGNRNWMRAREAMASSEIFGDDISKLFPICTPGGSDSASFDEVLEFLHLGGRPLPHAVLMMIPEAWENHESMSPERRAFYQFHASIMEPWDGPASIAFTDGTMIGAVLDRNGLRPSRFWVTADDRVIMASEVGVLPVEPENVISKGRLQPGRMFLVDTEAGRIISDDEIKSQLAAENPYSQWLHAHQLEIAELPDQEHVYASHESVLHAQRVFGYTREDLEILVRPMAIGGVEGLGSMGTDTPLAVLSTRSRLLYDYFKQLFAQVTNPPLDAIREELVTSLGTAVGPERNLLVPVPQSCSQVTIPYPIIDNDEFAKLAYLGNDGEHKQFASRILPFLFDVSRGAEGLREALGELCRQADRAIDDGMKLLILSDRGFDSHRAPIPALLAVASVHHHLIRRKTRTRVGLVVETGEAREIHHMCLLLGYGASAINPYLAFESIEDLVASGELGDLTPQKALRNYIKACGKGILKVMSKMGISTVASYLGAQVFEAIGLGDDLVDEYFTGTVSRLGGIGLTEIAAECKARHLLAYPDRPAELSHRDLPTGGEYKWRREGEIHLFNPDTVFKLQHSTRTRRFDVFKEYTRLVDDQSGRLATIRGLLRFKDGVREPISVDEVEPISEILKRFSTGAMSYGSISAEAHENLAIAMNRIGGKSNTGEGGEDSERFTPDENGDLRRSAIKQVASGRFGVTSEYLINSDDIQIKMAQGAKPGEGGQLPGHKVYPWVAKTRHSTPGVGLISPPPHHDIYSIEDLAQLIHDLKNANSRARIHVKLVSEVGVGTVATGVSKAHADVVLISGHDGGTGASPLTSIKHAGGPWELGLAETQQTLLRNGLRDRIVVQVDGQLKTGRDVVIGALLGAEEFGFATAPLVVSGCIMMRVCHLDSCPVGIATQDPELRARFNGRPEFVVNFFEFIAQEVRELLAQLGYRSIAEAVGHVESLDVSGAVEHWKASGLDLRPLLHFPDFPYDQDLHCTKEQDHALDRALDQKLLSLAKPALEDALPVSIEIAIRNVNRTVGTILGSEITRRYGPDGLAPNTVQVRFSGSAGQSFGAFAPRGLTLRLAGDANDYMGKGLSGGRIVVFPPEGSPFAAEDNVIAGNVILYGATSGEAYISGLVGERFCVRNSGATAVVEGVGDHGCEYMTGGRAVILGPTGRNFGAGMSGGVAYIFDPTKSSRGLINYEMVDVEPLSADDQRWLRETITTHAAETRSELAERLLRTWEDSAAQFIKVMPRDYKAVLAAKELAERTGEDWVGAVMAAARARV